jgi:hypothetical protein
MGNQGEEKKVIIQKMKTIKESPNNKSYRNIMPPINLEQELNRRKTGDFIPNKEARQNTDSETLEAASDNNSQLTKAKISANLKKRRKKEHEEFMACYHQWRGYDMMSMILSTTGLIIQFLNYEYDVQMHVHIRDPVKWPNAMDDPQLAGTHTNFVRMVGLFLTLNASFFLILRHYYKRKWKVEHFDKDYLTTMYWNY